MIRVNYIYKYFCQNQKSGFSHKLPNTFTDFGVRCYTDDPEESKTSKNDDKQFNIPK